MERVGFWAARETHPILQQQLQLAPLLVRLVRVEGCAQHHEIQLPSVALFASQAPARPMRERCNMQRFQKSSPVFSTTHHISSPCEESAVCLGVREPERV